MAAASHPAPALLLCPSLLLRRLLPASPLLPQLANRAHPGLRYAGLKTPAAGRTGCTAINYNYISLDSYRLSAVRGSRQVSVVGRQSFQTIIGCRPSKLPDNYRLSAVKGPRQLSVVGRQKKRDSYRLSAVKKKRQLSVVGRHINEAF